jgi:hypothetical protein
MVRKHHPKPPPHPRLQFPKRAVVQRMLEDGTWVEVPMRDEFGNEQHVWPDHQSATYALVRHVHRQFDLVLRGKLRIEEVPQPDSYRVIDIEEH